MKRTLSLLALLAATTPCFSGETPFAAAQPVTPGGSPSQARPRAVAVDDLDRDGDADLVFALQLPEQVSIRKRLPNGDYDTPVLVSDPSLGQSPPQHLRLGDIDNDGDTDIVFAKLDGSICTSRNDGSGTFAAASCIAGGARVELADINRDGWLDLVLAVGSGVEWRANNRDGTFTATQSVTFQRAGSGLAVADFNRDGRLDIARADAGVNAGISVHLNPASGTTWSTAQLFDTAVTSLVALDIDADGDIDVAAGRCNTTGHVIFRRNDGAGNFDSVSGLGVDEPTPGQTPCARTLVATDLDRDGRTDLVDADGHGRILYYRNAPEGFALERVAANAGAATDSVFHTVAVADLDLDGDADLLAAHGNENLVARSENRTVHRAIRVGVTQSGGVAMPGAETLLTGDVNRDGLPDVITLSSTDGVARFLRRTPTGFAAAATIDTNVTSARNGVLADVDRDGKLDLLYGNATLGRIMLKKGLGDGTFGPTINLGGGFLEIGQIVAADFDRDGDLDLAAVDAPFAVMRWLRNDGFGSFSVQPGTSSLDGVRSLAVADIDRDGWPDLVVAAETANRVYWLRNELRVIGTPDFTAVLLSDVPEIAGPRDAAVADVDRDGLLVVFVNSAGSRLSWLRQTAPLTFGPSQSLTSVTSGTGLVFARDIDGDARTDLVYTLGGVMSVLSDPVGAQGRGGYIVSSSNPRLALTIDDVDANGLADVLDVSSNGGLSARLTVASSARLGGSFVTMPFAPQQSDLRLAGLQLQHDGRASDDALTVRRVAFAFRRTSSSGALLSGAEYSQLLTNVRLFGDDGDGVFEPGIDPQLADTTNSDFNNGALSFALPATPPVTVAHGTTQNFHLVAQISPGALSVTPVLHVSASASESEIVDAVHGTRVDVSNDALGTTLNLDVIFVSRFQ
jgi:hypothetical protein